MKLSAVVALMAGSLSPSEFSAAIADELVVHSRALETLGGSAPVVVSEDTDLLLNRHGLGSLCRLFASGQLSAAELAYTADALQLSERVAFADPSVADDLAECTDPAINGPLTIARALEIASNGAAA
ncbi:hypothetical protein [Cognatiluteimonas telluris]|jgi:hypothetical protein|uniref:hypothetical protein n=1 Tax=Cognatiluteimonas telluris TaxID=1104775 RepID=UPI00140B24DC|nr:hypothetical protein [Lysobacter telluris]